MQTSNTTFAYSNKILEYRRLEGVTSPLLKATLSKLEKNEDKLESDPTEELTLVSTTNIWSVLLSKEP